MQAKRMSVVDSGGGQEAERRGRVSPRQGSSWARANGAQGRRVQVNAAARRGAKRGQEGTHRDSARGSEGERQRGSEAARVGARGLLDR